MSKIIFGNTVDLLTAGTPSAGGYIVAYDLDGILKQKDEFGVITEIGGGPTGGIGATPSLYDVLSVNNDTVTYDIIMGTSTSILSSNGGGQIDLDFGGSSNQVTISNDNGTLNKGWINLIDTKGEFGFDNSFLRTNTNSSSLYVDNIEQFIIANNSTASISSSGTNKYGAILASNNSSIDAGVVNSVIIGGGNLTGTQSNTVYLGNYVNINNAYTLPINDGSSGQVLTTDGSGNIYWAVDSSSFNLEQVLAVGNESGTYDIIMGTQTVIKSSNGGGQLELDAGGSSNSVVLSTDNGVLSTSNIQLDSSNIIIDSNDIDIISGGDTVINSSGTLALSGQTGSVVINNGQGLVYGFDYSSGFVNNSLVSKLYVDTGLSNYLPLVGGTLSGNLTVQGDLTVNGTQTIINTENLYVEDNIITLNATYSGAPIIDSGIEVNHGDGTYSKFIWDASENYWVAGLSGSEKPVTLGTGSMNWIPKWNSINELSTTSSIYDDGSEVTFNAPIVPGADDVYDIGTSASRWKDIYIGSKIDFIENVEFVHDGGETKMVVGTTSVTIKDNTDFLLEGGGNSLIIGMTPSDTGVKLIEGIEWIEYANNKIYVTNGGSFINVYNTNLELIKIFNINDDVDEFVNWPRYWSFYTLKFDSTSNQIFVSTILPGDSSQASGEGIIAKIDVITDTIEYGFYGAPLGTLWNSDGWSDLSDFETREYRSFLKTIDNGVFNSNPVNTIGAELVMKDVINNKYYRLMIDSWSSGQSGGGGGFSYSRAEITGTNSIGTTVSFIKTDYGNEVDVIDNKIQITRDDKLFLYNPYFESNFGTNAWGGNFYGTSFNVKLAAHDNYHLTYNNIDNKIYTYDTEPNIITVFDNNLNFVDVYDITSSSPAGTLWNSPYVSGTNSGFSDLSDYQTRRYTSFKKSLDKAFSKGGNDFWYDNVTGTEMVMHDTINDKYYKFVFDYWNNSSTGGFSYSRSEILGATSFGSTVSFIRTDNGTEVDIIDTGLEISRDDNNDPFYNSATESSYTDFGGYSIDVNTTNGDIYVVGRSTNQAQLSDRVGLVSIYATNSTLVKEIRGLSFSEIPRGIAYNSTNDSMYVGGTLHDIGGSSYTSSTIYVFDGSTREISSTLDVSTYSTSSINKIVSYEDEIIVSFGDTILNIDSSNNITIGLTSSNDINHATKAEDIYLYGDTNNDVFYDKLVSFTNQIYSPTASTDNVHTLQDKSGILAHLDDVPPIIDSTAISSGKTIWVDKTYGDNITGEAYNIRKPFNSISQALISATAGDLVYVRPGIYSETVTLKDGVNVWCDEGVRVTRISDNGSTVKCKWMGKAEVYYTSNNAIDIRGDYTDLYLELDKLTTLGTMFLVIGCIDVKLDVKINIAQGTYVNGGFVIRSYGRENNINIEVNELLPSNGIFTTTGTAYSWAALSVGRKYNAENYTFGGILNMKVNRFVSPKTTNSIPDRWFKFGGPIWSSGKINIDITTIECYEDKNQSGNVYEAMFGVNGISSGDVNINVRNPINLTNQRLLGYGNANSTVLQVKEASDGGLLLGGNFESIDKQVSQMFGKVKSNGEFDFDFDLGPNTFDTTVRDFIEQPDGKVIVVGEFRYFNGTSLSGYGVIRFNTDGTEDQRRTVIGNQVRTIELQSDGKIVYGGRFVEKIERLNTDFTIDGNFGVNIGTGFNGTDVNDIFIPSSGTFSDYIYVGGDFTSFNGTTTNKLARLNPDGTIDGTFSTNMGTGFNNIVNKVIVDSSDRILTGGQFTSFNGNTTNRLARLNPDGTFDGTFSTNMGTGFNDEVRDIAIESDGSIIAVGDFKSFDGITANKVIRLTPGGTASENQFYGFDDNNVHNVNCVSILSDGNILFGGTFRKYNDILNPRLLKVDSTTNNIIPLDGHPPSNASGITTINAKVKSDETLIMLRSYFGSEHGGLVIKDSTLLKNSGGTNTVIDTQFGYGHNVTLENSIIAKKFNPSNGNDPSNDGIIYISVDNSDWSIKDSQILMIGGYSGFAVSSANNPGALVHFRNTISNIDNSPYIIDSSVISGFIGNDRKINTQIW